MSLSWPDVAARIARGADAVTELTFWPAFPDKVAVALAAMANSEG